MRSIDKLKSDLSRSATELARTPASEKPAATRRILTRTLGAHGSLIESAHRNFEELRIIDEARAFAWLSTLAGILEKDYDDEALDRSEWERIRDIVNEAAGDLDLETLTYAMGLVLEHGAL